MESEPSLNLDFVISQILSEKPLVEHYSYGFCADAPEVPVLLRGFARIFHTNSYFCRHKECLY